MCHENRPARSPLLSSSRWFSDDSFRGPETRLARRFGRGSDRLRQILGLGLACVLLALCPTAVFAQGEQTGQIVGRVTAPDGSPAAGARVVALAEETAVERAVSTAANGDFSVRALPIGDYDVTIEAPGLQTFSRRVRVRLGLAEVLEVQLDLEAVEETLTVDATPTPVSNGEVSATLGERVIDELPVDRDPTAIARLAPGVTDSVFNGTVSMSGGIGYDNLVMVDGVDIGFSFFGNAHGPLDPVVGLYIEEAVAETQTLTAGIPASYGRFSGGVINAVTKSGTNELKGSARVDLRNPSWREETPFEEDAGIRRESRTNEVLSGTVGGKIVEDRLWFFGAVATSDRSEPTTLGLTRTSIDDQLDNERFDVKLTGNLQDRHSLELTVKRNETDVNGLFPSLRGFAGDPAVVDRYTLEHEADLLRYSGVLGPNLLVEGFYTERSFDAPGIGGSSTAIRDSPIYWDFLYNAPPFSEADTNLKFDSEQLSASVSMFLGSERGGSHDVRLGLSRYTETAFGGNSQSSTNVDFETPYLADADGRAVLDADGRPQPLFIPFGTFAFRHLVDVNASLELETTSAYLLDSWRVSDRLAVEIGARYEETQSEASDAGRVNEADVLLPRVAVTYTPDDRGRVRLTAGWGEYSGRTNLELFNETSLAVNLGFLVDIYVGPPGVGRDHAPGFDLGNYFELGGVLPTANVAYAPDIETPLNTELFLSAGVSLGERGYLELSYVDRDQGGGIARAREIGLGTTTVEFASGPRTLDNVEIRNSDRLDRQYEALELQGSFQLTSRWTLRGNATWQIENDGNYEGSTRFRPTTISEVESRRELLTERNFRRGRLSTGSELAARIWSFYQFDFGKAGSLQLGGLLRYDAGRPYSLTASVPLSAQQLARDPGYAGRPGSQEIFFGDRGDGEFDDITSFDLVAYYRLPLGSRWEPWLKLELRNAFDADGLASFNTFVSADMQGPTDADGLPVDFVRSPGFGEATTPLDYQTPREVRATVGIRF